MERALRVLSKANYAIAQAEDERELLNTICKIVVGDGGYIFAWIGYAEKDKTVRPVARGGVNDYLDIIKITWDESEAGRGPTSTAIRTKRPAVVRDITLDPLIEPWREEALTIGYASSIALPLIYQDEVLGALNIYSDKKYAFDEEEVRLLRELADNLAYGIAVMRERREKKSVEELYKTVIENTGTAMIVVDEDMRIVLANNEVERIYETSKEKIIGRSFTDFIAKDDLDKVVEYHKLRRFDVGLAPKSYEVKVVDVNGNIKHILSVVTMIPGTKQSIVSAIDVSELRKAERRAKESEERYKAIFEESPLAIMVVGVDMKIIECNNTTLKVFERRREEIVGKKWSELGIFEEAELPIIMKQFYKGLRGKSEIIEININVWGKEKWIRIVPVLLKKDGKPFAFLNMIEDVTSEKISEKRLKGMLEHIRLLLMIDKGIIAGESLDKILKDSLKILREMTGCEFACMTLSVGGIIDMIADPETFKSITTLFSDRKNIEILKIARGKGEVVRVESILELENLFEIEVELLKARMKSYILIPLMMRGEEIGSLLMASKTRISDLNFGLIRETANQLAIALHEATLYELKRKAYEQIEQNIEQFAILADHIRNPLAVILALAELEVENKETVEKIIEQVERIDEVIKKLDEGWLESEEIREFLKTSKQSH
jgi:PAS domain S-box-containing protein